jgi:hypothetical protein
MVGLAYNCECLKQGIVHSDHHIYFGDAGGGNDG